MPVLRLTPKGQQALAGKLEVRLTTRAQVEAPVATFEYDHGLFDYLRELRKTVAAELQVAAFIVLSDVTLRELAAVRPASVDAFRGVKGIGDRKAADFGARFVEAIREYCAANGLSTDNRVVVMPQPRPGGSAMNLTREQAFRLFDAGTSVAAAASELGRTPGTMLSYLEEYIATRKPANVDAWVSPERYRVIENAARQSGGTLLRPVFDALDGRASYDDIRIVMKHAGLR
jgi:ATP-dependent DNA helicase RecQ